MSTKKVVHVVGTGTVGEPLIGLLASMKEPLGIDEVTFHKRTPLVTDRPKVIHLMKKGARLAADDSARKGFRDIGLEIAYEHHEALRQASVVIDCTPSSVGLQNKAEFYEKYRDHTLGFIAQGSEFGFGKMYARGINERALVKGQDQFIQVVSCNTHNLSVLVDVIAHQDGGPDNLIEGRFVCIRRANDISQDGSFVPSPQVGSHKDSQFGTHHARDAYHLFATLGYRPNLYSSAMKVNSQYMHTLWFNIRVRRPTSVDAVKARFAADERVALTHKNTANVVFSFGRDYGHFGRILNQTVVVVNSLAVHNGTEVVGFCFTPQDGNSTLSSVAVASWFLYPENFESKIQCLKQFIFDEV